MPVFVPIVVLILLAVQARAELPLMIEDLITDKGKFKVNISLTYANSDRQSFSVGDPITVQTSSTSFINLPTTFGERLGNSDTAVLSVALSYGLTGRAEVYTRLSAIASRNRTSSVNGIASDRESGFADAWFGLNYQFKNDTDTPAFLGFVETAFREKHLRSVSSFKSATTGFTAYKAIDPIVFSLTAGYRLNQTRKGEQEDYKPGNLLFLNPSVAFAVNDRVTLTTGIQWNHNQSDRFNNRARKINRTSTDLLLGVGYGSVGNGTLNITFKINASGSNGSELRLNWAYTI